MGDEASAANVDERETQVEKIRQYIHRSLEQFQIVGAAVGIVKGNDVLLTEGYGHRDRDRNLPVTADTLFAIGSSTKAFTTMSVGLLVDEGKLDWDKPVSSYLPEFRLHDKYASDNATPRDLATHRVGLPRHEFVWYKAPLSREEIIRRLEHLPLTKPFRTVFQYQNMMYLTLGYLVEKVSGQTWETFVRTRILDPLGMKRTNLSVHASQQDDDYAKPYKQFGDETREVPFADIDAMAPAGAINSSVNEMTEWVKLHLRKHKSESKPLISDSSLAQMHTPHMFTGPSLDEHILAPGYGLGWFTEVYRGYQVIHHGGNIDGFTAIVALLPAEDIGVVVLVNQEVSSFPRAAIYTIFDTLLELPEVDWNQNVTEIMDKILAAMKEGQGTDHRVPDTTPSHELPSYAGEFGHPAYGTVTVRLDDGQFYADYHAFPHPVLLEHLHYDIFTMTVALEGGIEQTFKVQFQTDLNGKINRAAIQFEPLLPPFEFVRKVVPQPVNRELLEKYLGEFDLAAMTATVALRGEDTLTVTVPGQPTYELVPTSDTEFDLKGLSGFAVQFVLDEDGSCMEAKFKQPNGTFALKRK